MDIESSLTEEVLKIIFAPDVIAADDYWALYAKNAIRDVPEKALLLAILEEAFHCIRKYRCEGSNCEGGSKRKKCYHFHEAKEWVLNRDRDSITTFENVCEFLGLEPEYIRDGIIKRDFLLQKKQYTAKKVA